MTREEAKRRTRQRLLDAALEILDEEGEAGLTTTNVTQRAGIGQSSFYVHFSDMEELLRELIDNLWKRRAFLQRAARRRSRAAPHDHDLVRHALRVPIADLLEHPEVFRLVLRSRLDRSTALGEWTHSLLETSRRNLIEDLAALGAPTATEQDRRRLEMLADGFIGLTDVLTLGHLEGRYPDIEEIVDVLLLFSRGLLSLSAEGGQGSRRRTTST